MTHRLASRAPANESGFSLIELMVALVILAVGVLGLAAVTAVTVQNVTGAELDTERGQALQTVVEQLRSTPYDNLTNGSDSIGKYTVSWSVEDNGTSSTITIVTVGPGMALGDGGAMRSMSPAVADTFTYLVPSP